MRNNTLIIYTVSLIAIGLLTYILVFTNYNETSKEVVQEFEPFCGTMALTGYSEEAQLGRQLFNANCAACHKVFIRATGPAISRVIHKYKSDTLLWEFIQSKKDKPSDTAYYSRCMRFPQINLKEASQLHAYLYDSKN